MIGDAVNIAARLEQMNKRLGTWALISGATREAAGSAADEWTSLGEQPVRGRSAGVEVFARAAAAGAVAELVGTAAEPAAVAVQPLPDDLPDDLSDNS